MIRRKMLLFSIVLLFIVCFTSCYSIMGWTNGVTEVFHDQYTDTKYFTKMIRISLWEKSELRSDKKNYSYYIYSLDSPSWYFIDRAYFIVDGENFNYNSIKSDRDVRSGGSISEWVVFNIPLEVLRKIASSVESKVEFRGSKGRAEYILNEDYKHELSEYLTYIDTNSL